MRRISTKIEVLVLPAGELGPNTENPYDRMTLEERRARFVAVLLRLYREELAAKEPSSRAA